MAEADWAVSGPAARPKEAESPRRRSWVWLQSSWRSGLKTRYSTACCWWCDGCWLRWGRTPDRCNRTKTRSRSGPSGPFRLVTRTGALSVSRLERWAWFLLAIYPRSPTGIGAPDRLTNVAAPELTDAAEILRWSGEGKQWIAQLSLATVLKQRTYNNLTISLSVSFELARIIACTNGQTKR